LNAILEEFHIKTIDQMKHILLFPFLILFSCSNAQDETALFQEAISAAFEYLSTDSDFLSTQRGVTDPLVFSAFAVGLDDDVIRQDANEPERKRILEKAGFDIEESISIWEKYKGKDLSVYMAEKHLYFLVSKDSHRDRGTNISFSAPVFSRDTLCLFYMVFETNEENRISRAHQYVLFGKIKDSWKSAVEMWVNEED